MKELCQFQEPNKIQMVYSKLMNLLYLLKTCVPPLDQNNFYISATGFHFRSWKESGQVGVGED